MKITGSNVTIMVKNIDRAIEFYENIGLTLLQRWDDNYAMMKGEGITIGIHPSEGMVLTSGSLSIGFMIDDIVGAKARLNKHNILFSEQNDGKSGIYLNFKDHDGTHIYYVVPKW